jgi:5-methylcytosine-specific restriction endonuclease McrA
MAWGIGQSAPKPEPRKRVKGRQRRAARKIVTHVRADVVKRANGCCERCGLYCGDAGHAHHRIPRSRGGQWTVENIQYVCPGCHLEAHLTNAL